MGANGSHVHYQRDFNPKLYEGKWWVLGRMPSDKEPKYRTQFGENKINPKTGRMEITITNIHTDNTSSTILADQLPTSNPAITYFGMIGTPMEQRERDIVHWTDYENYAISGGGPGSDSLWLLTRSPVTFINEAGMMAKVAAKLGYDQNKIEFHDFNLIKQAKK